MALVILKSWVVFHPSLKIDNVTEVPFGQRIRVTASSADMLVASFQSIFIIWSPDFNPALLPGVPGSGAITVSKLFLMPISTPIPSNDPA